MAPARMLQVLAAHAGARKKTQQKTGSRLPDEAAAVHGEEGRCELRVISRPRQHSAVAWPCCGATAFRSVAAWRQARPGPHCGYGAHLHCEAMPGCAMCARY